jgi:hypothetical protein
MRDPIQKGDAERRRSAFPRRAKVLASFTLLVGVAWQGTDSCSAQQLPANPVPVAPPSGPTVAPPPPMPAQPAPGLASPVYPPPYPPPPPPLPPFAYGNPYEDTNGPLLRGDPLLDRVPNNPPGLFAAIEGDLVWVHISNHVTGNVAVDGFVDTIHLPTAELEFTGAPKFLLGWRFPQGFGEFQASYRSLVTEGGHNIPNFDPAGEGFLKSRLNMNVVDLDYSTQDIPLMTTMPGQQWDAKFFVGARIAGVFFDSRAEGFFMEQRSSNNFFGAGPQVGMETYYYFHDAPGLALYGKLEGSVVIGRIHQSFSETFFDEDGVPFLGGSSSQRGSQAVPVLELQAGLSWTPLYTARWLRFTGGYHFEQWWDVGTLGGSRSDLTSQGFFIRSEFHF